MKKTNVLFWVFTILFGGFMILSAIPNIMLEAENVKILSDMMGYPRYIIPFLGVAKVLGILAIVLPISPRIKEWAYAGLFFDLIGATYSGIAVAGGFMAPMLYMVLLLVLLFLSYYFHHKRLKAHATNTSTQWMPA